MNESQLEIGAVVAVHDEAYVDSFGHVGVITEVNGDKAYVARSKDADGYWIKVSDLSAYDPDAETEKPASDEEAQD